MLTKNIGINKAFERRINKALGVPDQNEQVLLPDNEARAILAEQDRRKTAKFIARKNRVRYFISQGKKVFF